MAGISIPNICLYGVCVVAILFLIYSLVKITQSYEEDIFGEDIDMIKVNIIDGGTMIRDEKLYIYNITANNIIVDESVDIDKPCLFLAEYEVHLTGQATSIQEALEMGQTYLGDEYTIVSIEEKERTERFSIG